MHGAHLSARGSTKRSAADAAVMLRLPRQTAWGVLQTLQLGSYWAAFFLSLSDTRMQQSETQQASVLALYLCALSQLSTPCTTRRSCTCLQASVLSVAAYQRNFGRRRRESQLSLTSLGFSVSEPQASRPDRAAAPAQLGRGGSGRRLPPAPRA